ncbi:hypothetical protein B0T44_00910 [Nocardia donostiensis]|uniref:Uncharacterized protein n=2 Tax=Nocardia donostiensis TaxID=1538463 RepID=A0A1V2TDN8_9NOCA|nr:hypothetical protein B0T46_17125 [Nocardia donostiensis]OQS15041.1 hypothetical protein B0T36_10175 [Nocardia donostiensis]OQS24214.1 hypothetical protein B0T44_00910 [Nocardia donostiensis]
MPHAVVFLKQSLCGNGRALLETHCGLLAAAHGFRIQRVVVHDEHDPFPWTLDEVLKSGPNGIIVPSLEHIDFRARQVLTRCSLLVGRPYGWYHRGAIDWYIAGLPPEGVAGAGKGG